jgi:Xaa-Pro aminopeptidase
VIDMGPRGGRRKLDGKDNIHRGVGEILTTAAFTSVAYTDGYQAELALDDLRRRNHRRIGFVGAGAMPHGFVRRIEQGLAAEFVDATDFVDRLKAIKSAEEIVLIRRAAEMQDQIFAKVAAKIRPGMSDAEITALAQYEGRLLGSEQGLFLGSSAPLGQRSDFVDRHQQRRTLKAGEHFSLLIENSGPGGQYTEIARTMVLGKASNELIDGFETVKEAQAQTLKLIKPGAAPRDIAAAHDAFMRARGLPEELRLYCHGQGYDLVERPLIRSDEPWVIQKDMNIVVHPTYAHGGYLNWLCDNYIIGGNGPGDRIHYFPEEIVEVDV